MTSQATIARAAETPPRPTPEVCIIGAGAAGLAAGQALLERGIAVDWFELSPYVGGLWRIENTSAAAYQSLHTNSSRPLTQYPNFPMPADWPDYPSHELIARYFESFAAEFGLMQHITFNTAVERVRPTDDGRWIVTTTGPVTPTDDGLRHIIAPTDDGQPNIRPTEPITPTDERWNTTTTETRSYRHVVIANGHHSVPRLPTFPGHYTGEVMHSHDYRDPAIFAGKRVLVVGVGNSGVDIAVDASRTAEATHLSTRHGVHVLPKYALGRPIDQLNRHLALLPFEVERRLYEWVLRFTVGTPQGRGMPKPDHRLLGAHPTVSAYLLDRVGEGAIAMKPDLTSLEGTTATFVDGSAAEVDLVVLATGYRITFPFLDKALIDPADNQLRLYQRVVHPDLDGLWFMGFIQTVGSGISLFGYQAQWVADLIEGRRELPDEQAMRRWLEQDQQALAKRYVRSSRHTIQVDYWRYVSAMDAERGRGVFNRIRSALPV